MDDVRITWGPGLIGLTISSSIYGITVAQTIFYLRTFPEDGKFLKSLVIFLLITDTLHIIWSADTFWYILIRGRQDCALLLQVPWELPAGAFYTYLVTFIVQSFFTHRVWRLSEGNKILTGTILVFALAQFAAGMDFAAGLTHYMKVDDPKTISKYVVDSPNVTIELSSSVVCDIIITGSLVYYLRSKRTGVRRSENVLQLLIIYTANIGLFGCITAFITLVLIHSRGSYSMAPSFFVSKCYVNSLLASLNARKSFREMFDYHGESFTLPSISNIQTDRLREPEGSSPPEV